MKLNLDDIKNKESGKIGIVLGLGPNLNEVLPNIEDFSNNSRDKFTFYCSNLFNSMTKIQTDYWVVINSQPIMNLKTSYERYNSQPDSIFVFAPRIDGFSEKEAEDLLTVDYVPITDQDGDKTNLPLGLQNYTSADTRYGAVHSVIIHQIALAIVTGCKEVYISGVNLDYSKGYVKKGVHERGVDLGRTFMNASARADTIDKVRFLRECAKNVGCELYSLNESSPLSQVLEVKTIDELKVKISNS